MIVGTSAGANNVSQAEDAGLPSLPRDLFLIVLSYLDFMDVIYCRRVSKSWRSAFSNSENLYPLLKWTFPFAREVRELEADLLSGQGPTIPIHDGYWRRLYDQVATRYFHLSRGIPRSIERFPVWLNYTFQPEIKSQVYPVEPWDIHKSHPFEKVDFAFASSSWTYEDGLLVYPSATDLCLVLRDLETSRSFNVPFPVERRVIRRFRLQDRVLVVEWAEPEAFHWLNNIDSVHRHFASAFDVNQAPNGWDIVFRNEWKIMFLGHPLSDRDRFHSSHNKTHYAMYAWQPNRSLYTADEDAPLESLFVWDISEPSDYQPSEDPAGHQKAATGPVLVARFSFRELEFYSVRQRGAPGMMRLDINSETGVIDIAENTCISGHASSWFPSSWSPHATVTSIPFIGQGPCWRRDVGLNFPPYRGGSSMQARPVSSNCHWYMCVSEVIDEKSEVIYTLHFDSRTWLQGKQSPLHLSIKTPFGGCTIDDSLAAEISFKGNIHGDERFVIGENDRKEVVVLRFDR